MLAFTDDDDRAHGRSTSVSILHPLVAMEEKGFDIARLGGLEGADAAALGVTPDPESAPAAAQVDDDLDLVPGADFERARPGEEKPWFTSLAAESDQAGVMNETLDPDEDIDRG